MAVLGLALLTACSPRAVVVGEDRSGSTVTIQPGQELRIQLSESASVGYRWEVTSEPDGDILEFLGRDVEADDPGVDGGTETVSFRYAGTGPGTTRVVLSRDYRGERIDRTFELTVEVE